MEELDRLELGRRVAVHLAEEAHPRRGATYIRAKLQAANVVPMRPETIEGRWAARGAIVDEHEFSFYGTRDPAFRRADEDGVRIRCSCGAVHFLEPGHTLSAMIRLVCNEVGIP